MEMGAVSVFSSRKDFGGEEDVLETFQRFSPTKCEYDSLQCLALQFSKFWDRKASCLLCQYVIKQEEKSLCLAERESFT